MDLHFYFRSVLNWMPDRMQQQYCKYYRKCELFADEVISAIAKDHDMASAQVILRWNLQKGVCVIPGSSSPEHIRENISLFDFALTDEEMESIAAINKNEKHDWY